LNVVTFRFGKNAAKNFPRKIEANAAENPA